MDKLSKGLEHSEEQGSDGSSALQTFSESDYPTYNCKYCLYSTRTTEDLQTHEHIHLRKELKPLHTCGSCNRKFVQKAELEEHKKEHAAGTACSLCSYTSPNKNTLKNHVRAHRNKRSFQCLFCQERMVTRKMLDDHMNKHVLKLSCKWCKFTSDSPSRLKSHIQVHMKTKEIRCKWCDYFCFFEVDMKQHSTLHGNAKGDNVRHSENQVVKVNSSNKKDIKDTIKNSNKSCLIEKSAPAEQGNPFNSNTFKRMLKRAFFKCSICGEVQKSSEALQHHSYKHIIEMQYTCHICSFKGKNREEITKHVINHLPVVDLSEVGK